MKKIINVYGTARCGSTMLDLILGNDPKGFSLGEVVNWFYPWRSHHFDIKCGCGVYPCPVWEEIKDFKPDKFHEKVLDIFNLDFLVDSSKNLPWFIDTNLRGYKEKKYKVYNVLIFKDPISLYYSFWKRGDKSISKLFNAYNDYKIFLDSNLSFVSLNYDEFVADPQRLLKKMCSILNIDYFEDKYKFWNKKHHHLFGSFGTRKQLFNENAKIYQENYSQDFLEIKKNVEEEIKKNKELNLLITDIYKNDIKKINKYPEIKNFSLIRKDKNDYYKSRFRRYFRRFKPVHYPDKESKLIHTYRF
jgi:hypothetical protein